MGISVFDVIGPIMVGPSSSHTAGAMRIAQLARSLFSQPIKKAEFTLFGSFKKTYKGHGTDRALVAGILGMSLEDPLVSESLELAKKEGLEVTFLTGKSTSSTHPNTVAIQIAGENKVMEVVGESLGGGKVNIRSINNIEVDFKGERPTFVILQRNVAGVVAHISTSVGDVNIATMKVYEKDKEFAYTILELDEDLPCNKVDRMKEHQAILEAIHLCP